MTTTTPSTREATSHFSGSSARFGQSRVRVVRSVNPGTGDDDPGDVNANARSPMGPTSLATSQEIRDRGSAFVGYIYRAGTVEQARTALGRCTIHGEKSGPDPGARSGVASGDRDRDVGHGEVVRTGGHTDGRGPYVIAAWRCMAVKPGRTGLGGPDDFAVQEGCDDGGERWAGQRILGVMKREGAIDAVVIVCRWFGGTLLGPVRFTHIETCASEVCRRFKKVEEMDECIQTLKTLDDVLTALRAELATARERAGTQDSGSTAENPQVKAAPDYQAMQDSLDLTKAKRLIHARECGIKATKSLIEKCKTST